MNILLFQNLDKYKNIKKLYFYLKIAVSDMSVLIISITPTVVMIMRCPSLERRNHIGLVPQFCCIVSTTSSKNHSGWMKCDRPNTETVFFKCRDACCRTAIGFQ